MALLTIDANLDVVEANQALAELFGRTVAHVIGRPLVELMTPDDPQVIARHIAGCLQEQRMLTIEIECRTALGERRVFELSSSPQQRTEGAVAVSVCRNIGTHRESEDAQLLLSNLTVALLGVLDLQQLAGQLARALVPRLASACLVYAREAADALDAKAAQAAAGPMPRIATVRVDSDGPPPWADAEVDANLASVATEVARTGTARVLALGAPGAHGCEPAHEAYVVPMGVPAAPLGAIVLLRASHDRRERTPWRALADEAACRASLAFAAAQRFRERDRAVEARDELIAMLSHDLRNGLGTVSMNCQLLLRPRATDEALEVWQRRLEAVKRATDWMTELAEDLLDQRALELGRLVMDRPPTPVAPVCQEALALHESVATEMGARLVLEDTSDGAIVLADRVRMLQVLDNLIANALQASSPRSDVILRVSAEPEHVRFSVRDSGRGIVLPEGGAAALFTGGARGSSSLRGRGRGLGLPIARTLVHAMGGEIGVARLPDAGTNFYFTLPRTTTVTA